MANHVGSTLSRLINERAYTAGRCVKLRSIRDELQAKLQTTKRDIKRLEARLAELDLSITTMSAIEPSDIKEIQAMPRCIVMRHGTFRREMVSFLQSAGKSVTTGEIIAHMATKFDLPLGSPADRRRTRDAIRRPLNRFHEMGVVTRLESHDDSLQGVWCWKGDYEVGDGSGA